MVRILVGTLFFHFVVLPVLAKEDTSISILSDLKTSFSIRHGQMILDTSLCHTDVFTLTATTQKDFSDGLRARGCWIVEIVGEGVTGFQPGDRVIPLAVPQCKECEFCLNTKTNFCQKIRFSRLRSVTNIC